MISVLYNIILITNFKLIEMCIKSSSKGGEFPPAPRLNQQSLTKGEL